MVIVFFNAIDWSLVTETIYFGLPACKKEVYTREKELQKRTFGSFIFPKPGRKLKPRASNEHPSRVVGGCRIKKKKAKAP